MVLTEALHYLSTAFRAFDADMLADRLCIFTGREVTAGIKFAITPAVNKNQDPKLCEAVIKKAKEQIIPNAKRLIGAIDF